MNELFDGEELPAGWALAVIHDVKQQVQYGTSHKPIEDVNGIAILRMGNIQDGEVDPTNLKYLPADIRGIDAFLLDSGDILFNRTNSPELVGKAAVFRQGGRITFASYLIRLKVDSSLVSPEFLNLWINSSWGKEWARRVRTDGVSQSNINSTKLLAMPFPLAPLVEQHRIVEAVQQVCIRIKSARERLERVSATMKRFRQAVLAAACSGRLTADWRTSNSSSANVRKTLERLSEARKADWESREGAKMARRGGVPRNDEWKQRYKPPTGPTLPDDSELPDGWEWATVAQVARLDVGYAFKSSEFEGNGIRLLRGENLEPGSLRWLDVKYWPEEKVAEFKHFLIESGEIILALDRPVISSGLKIARAKPSDLPCLLVQRMMRFKLFDSELTDYLYLCLQTNQFIDSLHDSTTGSDIPHITGTGVAEFSFPLPPDDERVEVVRRVSALFALADSFEQRAASALKRVESLTQAVLAKAFRGELVPTEAELARREERTYETADELLARIRATSAAVAKPKRARKATG